MSAICDVHKKKVDGEQLYNSVHGKFNQLEIRCGRENQHPGRLGPQAPGWAAQENGKECCYGHKSGGSICCSSVPSPTPSHTQPFQIKWELYFSRELCRSSLLCRRYDSACRCMCIMLLYNIFHYVRISTIPNYFQCFCQKIVSQILPLYKYIEYLPIRMLHVFFFSIWTFA